MRGAGRVLVVVLISGIALYVVTEVPTVTGGFYVGVFYTLAFTYWVLR